VSAVLNPPRFAGHVEFDPRSLFAGEVGGLYDVSDTATLFQDDAGTIPVTAVGQSVAFVGDKSGNGSHLTQSNPSRRPTYQVDGAGRPYLLFDGVDDGLSVSLNLGFPYDRVSAISQLTWSVNKRVMCVGGSNLLKQASPSPGIAVQDGIGGVVESASLPIGANGVVTERHAAGASALAVNNEPYSLGDAGSTAPIGPFSIGSDPAGNNASSIRLYAVLIRNGSLRSSDIARLRTWMGKRSGLTL